MDCFPVRRSKKELENEDEFFDFSYYKIERSKTITSDDYQVKNAALAAKQKSNSLPIPTSNPDDVMYKKKFASIFAWLDGQEAVDEACPCCGDLQDGHYACTDVTRSSKLITFSPHNRNFDSDVKYARTYSFSHNRSSSQQQLVEPPAAAAVNRHPTAAVAAASSRQRAMSLNSQQFRYQAMNQQSRAGTPRSGQLALKPTSEEYHYSTPNSHYNYSSPSSYQSANSRTGLLDNHSPRGSTQYVARNSYHHPTTVQSSSRRRPSLNLDNSPNSSQHSRAGSLDSTGNTEYIYLDFQAGSTNSLLSANSSSAWQVTKKSAVESPLRKAYL